MWLCFRFYDAGVLGEPPECFAHPNRYEVSMAQKKNADVGGHCEAHLQTVSPSVAITSYHLWTYQWASGFKEEGYVFA